MEKEWILGWAGRKLQGVGTLTVADSELESPHQWWAPQLWKALAKTGCPATGGVSEKFLCGVLGQSPFPLEDSEILWREPDVPTWVFLGGWDME